MLLEELKSLFARTPDIRLAVLFGSLARGHAHAGRDIDIAAAGAAPLSAERRKELIEELAMLTGRPVDLVDLRVAGLPIITQALTKGKLIYCQDRNLYADMIKRMWYERADFGPIRERILAERRRAWTGKI